MTEYHPTLREQSEVILRDIRAHLSGIHGYPNNKRHPLWNTSPCHGNFPCDYLDRLTAEREALAVLIQREAYPDLTPEVQAVFDRIARS